MMSSPGTGTAILFQDDFSANEQQLDPATWDDNRGDPADNPSVLGLAKMGQSLPLQENATARHAVCSSGDGSSTR
jgi:hypothetical protein